MALLCHKKTTRKLHLQIQCIFNNSLCPYRRCMFNNILVELLRVTQPLKDNLKRIRMSFYWTTTCKKCIFWHMRPVKVQIGLSVPRNLSWHYTVYDKIHLNVWLSKERRVKVQIRLWIGNLIWDSVCLGYIFSLWGLREIDRLSGRHTSQISFVPLWKEVYSKRNEFAHRGSKFFPYKVDLVSEVLLYIVKQTGNPKNCLQLRKWRKLYPVQPISLNYFSAGSILNWWIPPHGFLSFNSKFQPVGTKCP